MSPDGQFSGTLVQKTSWSRRETIVMIVVHPSNIVKAKKLMSLSQHGAPNGDAKEIGGRDHDV